MQEEGYIAKLLFPEGAKDVPLGTTIAILVEDEADIAAFANYTGDSSAPAQAAPAQAQAPTPAKSSAPAKSYPDHIVLEMPNLSPTMEKVSTIFPVAVIINFSRAISKFGTRLLAMQSPPEMSLLALKPTKLLLTLRCKKRVSSQNCFTPKVPLTCPWAFLLPFWLKTRLISLHSLTMFLELPKPRLVSQLPLKPQLRHQLLLARQ